MSKRSDSFLLLDILDAADKIRQYTAGFTKESFLRDSRTMDAVVRNFEIIGEAANRLSEDFKELNTQVDWHKIRGFRNRIVHDYLDTDFEIVWELSQNNLADLQNAVKEIQSRIQ